MGSGNTTGRYARQARVSTIGEDGQARIARSHAMIVGVGALGCVSADLLARAGVGTITLVDRDLVEVSNLHRQTLYTQADAEAHTPKAVAAKARLEAVNPEITVHAHIADFSAANAEDLLEHGWALPDVLIDGSDNFETRYLINDLAVKDGIPYVYGGAIGTAGSTAVFVGPGGSRPCLRCVFKDPPAPGSQPTCESAGVLGPVSAIVGAAQAGEAIKILSGDAGRRPSTRTGSSPGSDLRKLISSLLPCLADPRPDAGRALRTGSPRTAGNR